MENKKFRLIAITVFLTLLAGGTLFFGPGKALAIPPCNDSGGLCGPTCGSGETLVLSSDCTPNTCTIDGSWNDRYGTCRKSISVSPASISASASCVCPAAMPAVVASRWASTCPAGWTDTGLVDQDLGDGKKLEEDTASGGGGSGRLCIQLQQPAGTPVSGVNLTATWRSSCLSGETNTQLQDSDFGDGHIVEEDSANSGGGSGRLCVGVSSSSYTLSSNWSGSCSTGGTGLTDCDSGDGHLVNEDSCNGGGSQTQMCLMATSTVSTCAPSAAGTIQIESMNSVTLAPVDASWQFSGGLDPCGGSLSLCSGTTKQYLDQPSGSYTIDAPYGGRTKPSGYVFNRTEGSSLSSLRDDKEFSGLSFFNDIFFKLANAVSFGCISGTSTGLNSCFLSSSDLLIFDIFWDPLATLSVSPTTVSLSATTGASAQSAVTVSNGGTDGATLQWSASDNQPWLSVSPASGSDIAAGSSSTVTVTADTTGLAVGTYTGIITFTGTSNPSGDSLADQDISVTLVVGCLSGETNPHLECQSNSCVSVGACGPNSGGCTSAGQTCGISVSCSPPSQTANVGTAVHFSATGGDGTSYSWSASGGSPSSGSGSSFSTTYSAAGTKTVTVTSASTNDSCDVNVVALSCTFTADPTNITVPQPTNLIWTCTNADACNITPGVNPSSVNPISGSVLVYPTSTTIYTLSCTGAGGGSYVAPVEVHVATSTLIEV